MDPSEATDADPLLSSIEEPGMFMPVVERHLQAVSRFVAKRLGAQLAEDLAAETFLVAFASGDVSISVDRTRDHGSWVSRITSFDTTFELRDVDLPHTPDIHWRRRSATRLRTRSIV
jgi:hypothetical protein